MNELKKSLKQAYQGYAEQIGDVFVTQYITGFPSEVFDEVAIDTITEILKEELDVDYLLEFLAEFIVESVQPTEEESEVLLAYLNTPVAKRMFTVLSNTNMEGLDTNKLLGNSEARLEALFNNQ